MANRTAATPLFWRDAALPFIEARATEDGRRVCYDRHTHDTFSIGAITRGRSLYWNGRARAQVGAGALVIINPEEVHACEALGDDAWSFRMLYVSVPWMTALQRQLGLNANRDFRPFASITSTDADLYRGLDRLYRVLVDCDETQLHKHEATILFFTELQRRLQTTPRERPLASDRLARAAEYIDDNFAQSPKLEEICAAAGLSPFYLVRAFKKRYGLTPHAYLIDRRIRYCRAALRRRRPIVEVAMEAGFADQSHLPRTFKRLVAATPRQYMAAYHN